MNEKKQDQDQEIKPEIEENNLSEEEKENSQAEETPQEELWKDKYIRLCADFENAKKRMLREQLSWEHLAHKEMITQLLPILDDLERASTTLTEGKDQWEETQKGITLIHQNFYQVLLKKGIKPMEVNVGDELDPTRHQALNQVKVEDPAMKGKIIEVFTKGYSLNNQIIRHAQVIIGA